jgi:hypothetical protein
MADKESYWSRHHTGIIQCVLGLYCAGLSTLEYLRPRPMPSTGTSGGAIVAHTYAMPWYLLAGIIALVLSVIIPALVRMVSKERTRRNELAPAANTAGRDNSGLQLSNSGTFMGDSALEKLLAANHAPVTTPALTPPVISITDSQVGCLAWGRVEWEFMGPTKVKPGARSGAVAWVENDRTSKYISSLCAQLKFTVDGKQVGHVDRAYWAGESGNTISVGIGVRRAVVLGRLGMDTWEYFNNPREDEWVFNSFGGSSFPRLHQHTISFLAPIEIEISIMALRGGGGFIGSARYRISPRPQDSRFDLEVIQ